MAKVRIDPFIAPARRLRILPATARLNRKFYEEVPDSRRWRERGDTESTYGFNDTHHGGSLIRSGA